MERFSYRDHVLLGLGYRSPRRSPGSSPKTPSRDSDVNFSDVFGGPPRRSSIHELRHSLGDTLDSNAHGVERRGEEEEALASSSSLSAMSEKPVFGEGVLARRRYTSDDFFDDIFRGDESSNPTPRKPDRDPFSSTTASSILSPVHRLASKPEAFGPPSLPTQLSFSPKLAKAMDFPVYNTSTSGIPRRSKDGAQNAGFPSSPGAFIARDPNQVIQEQDDLKNDARPSYCQSPLSYEFSLGSAESSKAIRCGNEEKRGQGEEGSSCSETHEEHFHFSIYKWASIGVPLVMPLRGGNSSSSKERGNDSSSSSSKERGKSEIVASELSTEIPSLNDRTSSADSLFHIECENQGNISVLNSVAKDRIYSFRFNERAGSLKPDREPHQSLGNITTEVAHSLTMQKEVKETNPFPGVSGSSPDKCLHGGMKEETHVSMQEKGKAEFKSLTSLVYENYDGQGKDGTARQAEGKEDKDVRIETIGTSSGNIATGKRLEKQDKRKILDASNNRLQGTGASSRDLGNKVKGKIKEFVKIFNQEALQNQINNVGTQANSSRWKEKGTSEADEGAPISATRSDGKENVTNLNRDKTLTNDQATVDQTLKQPERTHFIVNDNTHKTYETSSGRTSNSASCSETIPATFEASLLNVEESHHEDLQSSYLVKEQSLNQHRQQQIFEYREEIQKSDARIRQWSNGKETNIRSLLSTLQYVLWPESGWKPVPLVDIIEGNSVKRAYQKALLCLHPDKLQQKGAAPLQKHVAEKVYDILQEAWTHFNSLGSF